MRRKERDCQYMTKHDKRQSIARRGDEMWEDRRGESIEAALNLHRCGNKAGRHGRTGGLEIWTQIQGGVAGYHRY
eukprot:751499-Hanusia_phi.AAC.3